MLHPVPSDLLLAAHKPLAAEVEAAVEIEIEVAAEVEAEVEVEAVVEIEAAGEAAVVVEIEAAGKVAGAVVGPSDSAVGYGGSVQRHCHSRRLEGAFVLAGRSFHRKKCHARLVVLIKVMVRTMRSFGMPGILNIWFEQHSARCSGTRLSRLAYFMSS